MSNSENDFSHLCPCEMGAAWTGFNWEKYPGGVQVSAALAVGKRLLLVKPVHWNRVIPQCLMKQDDTLEGAMATIYKELEKKHGIKVSGIRGVSVQWVLECSGALHVLVVVPCSQISGSGTSIEQVDSALMLSGYAVSNPMVRFIPGLLGWSDAHMMDKLGVEKIPMAA